ncbi:hypothetical protein D3C86_2117010 [compost metagenome]
MELHRYEFEGGFPLIEVTKQLESVIQATGQQQQSLVMQGKRLVDVHAVRVGHILKLDLATIHPAENAFLIVL